MLEDKSDSREVNLCEVALTDVSNFRKSWDQAVCREDDSLASGWEKVREA